MSHIKCTRLKFNKPQLVISGAFAVSNIRDHNDKLIYTPREWQCDSLEEYDQRALGIISDLLSGEIQIVKTSLISKRLEKLKTMPYVEPCEGGVWYKLKSDLSESKRHMIVNLVAVSTN